MRIFLLALFLPLAAFGQFSFGTPSGDSCTVVCAKGATPPPPPPPVYVPPVVTAPPANAMPFPPPLTSPKVPTGIFIAPEGVAAALVQIINENASPNMVWSATVSVTAGDRSATGACAVRLASNGSGFFVAPKKHPAYPTCIIAAGARWYVTIWQESGTDNGVNFSYSPQPVPQ